MGLTRCYKTEVFLHLSLLTAMSRQSDSQCCPYMCVHSIPVKLNQPQLFATLRNRARKIYQTTQAFNYLFFYFAPRCFISFTLFDCIYLRSLHCLLLSMCMSCIVLFGLITTMTTYYYMGSYEQSKRGQHDCKSTCFYYHIRTTQVRHQFVRLGTALYQELRGASAALDRSLAAEESWRSRRATQHQQYRHMDTQTYLYKPIITMDHSLTWPVKFRAKLRNSLFWQRNKPSHEI